MCCGRGFVFIFEASDLQSQKLAFGDLGNHPGEFLLHQLVRGDGLIVELLAEQ